MSSAGLFAWLQDAAFYRQFHAEAVALMGQGAGRSWLDVGTGPGILARLAAGHGYRARGIDRDAAMIEAALRLAHERGSDAAFAASDLETELGDGRRYDVVSASSFVVVTPDPDQTLDRLNDLVAPGGRLLIIEASPEMTRLRALRLLAGGRLGKRGYMLLPWAMARSGRTLDESLMKKINPLAVCHRLIHSMVNAWILEARPSTLSSMT